MKENCVLWSELRDLSPLAFVVSRVKWNIKWYKPFAPKINTKDIRKVKIQSPENICKKFWGRDSLVALLQHTFIYFST
jgi:hypothetical protein